MKYSQIIYGKIINFIEIVFNSSYRKIIDSGKYENYNQLNINLDLIEAEMTNDVLKGKKLLNNEFIDFKYKDDIFSASIDDLITTFESKYAISDITIEDKVVIYEDNKNNLLLCKNMIINSIELIKYYNGKKKILIK